jgi:hypothetical protein
MKFYTIATDPDQTLFPLKELAGQSAYGLDKNEVIDAVADLQVGETYVAEPAEGIAVTRVQ